MSKEIKFRAWDRENKYMIDHTYLACYVFKDILEYPNFELMQFTGLKERTANTSDNKEIYEGDIVRVWGGEYYQGYWEFDMVVIIKDMINDCFYIGESEYVEIIGNVWENPEIIEKEENRKAVVLNKTSLW